MLGSFPPKRIRWSMDFFYPNLQNDMWRIVGYLASGDRNHFLASGGKAFDRERIMAFCRERGLALYDTAEEVIRLKDNASDNFLQVVRQVDLAASRVSCDRHDRTEGDRDALRRYGLRAASGRRICGVRLRGPGAAALPHAVVVAGLSAFGGVEGGVLSRGIRSVRHRGLAGRRSGGKKSATRMKKSRIASFCLSSGRSGSGCAGAIYFQCPLAKRPISIIFVWSFCNKILWL